MNFSGFRRVLGGQDFLNSKQQQIGGCQPRPSFTQSSGRNFLPELCGEVHPRAAPLQALHCALCSTEQSTFRGKKWRKCAEKRGRGVASKRGKKEKGRVKLEVANPFRRVPISILEAEIVFGVLYIPIPFMILNPPPRDDCRTMGFSCRRMHFPAEKGFSCRKMRFPEEKKRSTFLLENAAFGGHIAGNLRKSQEGFRAQESRTLANFHKNILNSKPLNYVTVIAENS